MNTSHDLEVLDLRRFSAPRECPICHGASFRTIGNVPTIHPQSVLQISLLRCDTCGHWFSSPRPEQEYLSELYSSGSLSVLGGGWASSTAEQSAKLHGRADSPKFNHWILDDEAKANPGNYLEIGPGDSHLLLAFRDRGWNAWGVEPGDWGQGIPQIVRSLSSLPPELTFSVVVIHDVLEHLSEPQQLLHEVNRKIAHGGRLYLAFPNVDSVEARLLKTKWSMVRPIGHLHYFSRRSLGHLLQNNGFGIAYAKKANVGASWSVVRNAARRIALERNVGGFLTITKFLVKRVLNVMQMGDQWRVQAVKHDLKR